MTKVDAWAGRLDGLVVPDCSLEGHWHSLVKRFREAPDAKWIDAQERLLFNAWASRFKDTLPNESPGAEIVDSTLYLTHFIPFAGQYELDGIPFNLSLETRFPSDGRMRWKLQTAAPIRFALMIRIPGWSDNQPSPNPAYRYWHKTNRKMTLSIDGEWVFPTVEKGFARVEKDWNGAHIIELTLPLAVRKIIVQDPLVGVDSFALGWGPVLYGVKKERIPEAGFSPLSRWEEWTTSECLSLLAIPADSVEAISQPYQALATEGIYFLPVSPD
ncbi:MAG: hypothetical protein AAFV07_05165 [Bacteroidota bacterium]